MKGPQGRNAAARTRGRGDERKGRRTETRQRASKGGTTERAERFGPAARPAARPAGRPSAARPAQQT